MNEVDGYMNVIEYIEYHKDCPLSFFIAYCEEELRREPTLIGKAFFTAVLDYI